MLACLKLVFIDSSVERFLFFLAGRISGWAVSLGWAIKTHRISHNTKLHYNLMGADKQYQNNHGQCITREKRTLVDSAHALMEHWSIEKVVQLQENLTPWSPALVQLDRSDNMHTCFQWSTCGSCSCLGKWGSRQEESHHSCQSAGSINAVKWNRTFVSL